MHLGIQRLGIFVEIDIAGPVNLDLGFFRGRDMDIAMTADLHLGGACLHLTEIGIARAGNIDFDIIDLDRKSTRLNSSH